jgi:hypothetical protein
MVLGTHATQQLAVVGPTGDHNVPFVAIRDKQGTCIKTQVPFLGDGTVTREAAIPQQRLDVASVVDRRWRGGRGAGRLGLGHRNVRRQHKPTDK